MYKRKNRNKVELLKHCQTEHINASQLLKSDFTPRICMRT